MTAIDPGRATPAVPVAESTLPLLTGPGGRLATVAVNLLPGEVVTARHARKARRATFVALVVLALALGAVSFLARVDVGAARSELAAADGVSAGLRSQQGRYADVVALQEQARTAAEQLGQVTAGDLDWAPLLTATLAAAPTGLVVAGLDGAQDTAQGATAAAVTLTVTGLATSPTVVAAYADALTGVAGLANVTVTGVAVDQDGAYTFGITTAVTAAAALPTPTATGGR